MRTHIAETNHIWLKLAKRSKLKGWGRKRLNAHIRLTHLKKKAYKKQKSASTLHIQIQYYNLPATFFKPTSNVIPHIIRLKGIKEKIGSFNQFCCFLVFSQFAERKTEHFIFLHFISELHNYTLSWVYSLPVDTDKFSSPHPYNGCCSRAQYISRLVIPVSFHRC